MQCLLHLFYIQDSLRTLNENLTQNNQKRKQTIYNRKINLSKKIFCFLNLFAPAADFIELVSSNKSFGFELALPYLQFVLGARQMTISLTL